MSLIQMNRLKLPSRKMMTPAMITHNRLMNVKRLQTQLVNTLKRVVSDDVNRNK